MKLIEKFKNNRYLIPLVLLGVVFITYGYQLFQMGFYLDDWEIVYLNHFRTSQAYLDYFHNNSPLTGWFYLLLTSLVGIKPVAWQVINIVLRWAGLVGFWWTLRLVWPKRSFEVGWICLLLAVYPAFTLQSVAVTYSRFFACIALYAISLGLNLSAVNNHRRWRLFTILGVLASLLQLLISEYFFVLEVLRPLFIWIILSRRGLGWKITLKTLLFQWLPYGLVLLVFAGYRFLWLPAVSINGEANTPVLFYLFTDTVKFINLVIQGLIHINLDNWLNPFDPDVFELRAKANWLSWGIAGLVTVVCAWLILKTANETGNDNGEKDHFSREAILIGLTGVLAGGSPVWVTGQKFSGGSWSDHYVLGLMFSAVLLLVGIVHWFSRQRLKQTILLGVIFGFAMSSQMQMVNKYRLNQDIQNDYYWQLAWRAPGIKPGTAIVSPAMPFALINEKQVGFALNSIYDQNGTSFETPLWFFKADNLTGDLISGFKPGKTFEYQYKSVHFKGSTDQLLVADNSSGAGCLRIVTEEDMYRDDLSNADRSLFKLSNPDLIDLHPATPIIPPLEVFGPEPEHDWCYTFQKMEIACQEKDWSEAARLADEATEIGQSPTLVVEYTPIILSYIHTAQPEKALAASLAAQKMDTNKTTYICSLWKNTLAAMPEMAGWPDKANTSLECDAAQVAK